MEGTFTTIRTLLKDRVETNELLKAMSEQQKLHSTQIQEMEKEYQRVLLGSTIERDGVIREMKTTQEALAGMLRAKSEELKQFANQTNKELIDLTKAIDESKLSVGL